MSRQRILVAIVFLLAATALAACGGTTQSQPTVVPPPTQAPLPTPEPTATPPADALIDLPAADCCRGRRLDAGSYQAPDWLGISLNLSAGDGWRVLNQSPAELLALVQGSNELNLPNRWLAFMNAGDRPPAEILAEVRGMAELTTLAEPAAVTIAGYDGLQLDSAANPNPDYAGSPHQDIPPGVQHLPVFRQFVAPGFLWTTSSPEARLRTIALTVGETTLLLYIEAPAAEFDAFMAEADAVLQSLTSGTVTPRP